MSTDKPAGRIYIDLHLLREMLLLPEGYEIVGVTAPPVVVDHSLRSDALALHVTGPKVTEEGQRLNPIYQMVAGETRLLEIGA